MVKNCKVFHFCKRISAIKIVGGVEWWDLSKTILATIAALILYANMKNKNFADPIAHYKAISQYVKMYGFLDLWFSMHIFRIKICISSFRKL